MWRILQLNKQLSSIPSVEVDFSSNTHPKLDSLGDIPTDEMSY
jgi:hypothetical protein